MKIAFNRSASSAGQALRTVGAQLSQKLLKLSSGLRVQGPKDDPTAYRLGESLASKSRAYSQGSNNLRLGNNLLEAQSQLLEAQSNLVQRMRELAVQGANGVLSSEDRANLQNELSSLLKEFERLSAQKRELLGGESRLSLDVSGGGQSLTQVDLQAAKTSDVFRKQTGSGHLLERMGVLYANEYRTPSDLQDLNRDGLLDVIVTDFSSGSSSVRLGRGDGSFQTVSTFSVNVGSAPPEFVDLNGDTILDLLVSNSAGTSVSVFLGEGDGRFTAVATLSVGSSPATPEFGDFNEDGVVDLAITNWGSASVSVRLGNGDGTFSTAATLTADSFAQRPQLADVNGDGHLDVLVGNSGTNSISLRLGNGDGSFSIGTTITVGAGPYTPEILDLNGDENLDLVVSNYTQNNISIRLGNGDGTFSTAATLTAGSLPSAPQIADLNGDGHWDLVVSNLGSANLSVRLGNGDGSFATGATITIGAGPTTPTITDLNGDNVADLLVRNNVNHEVSVRLGHGDGTFYVGSTLNLFEGADAPDNGNARLVVGDINNDGAIDVVGSAYDEMFNSSRLKVFIGRTRTRTAVSDLDLSSDVKAQRSLDILDRALETITSMQSSLESQRRSYEIGLQEAEKIIDVIESSRESLVGVDLSQEMMESVQLQILQQSALAASAQANSSFRSVLQLLS